MIANGMGSFYFLKSLRVLAFRGFKIRNRFICLSTEFAARPEEINRMVHSDFNMNPKNVDKK
jgi:hypothetical protein